jgi:hypothetical protein
MSDDLPFDDLKKAHRASPITTDAEWIAIVFMLQRIGSRCQATPDASDTAVRLIDAAVLAIESSDRWKRIKAPSRDD